MWNTISPVTDMDRAGWSRREDVQFWVCLEVGYGLNGMEFGRHRGLVGI